MKRAILTMLVFAAACSSPSVPAPSATSSITGVPPSEVPTAISLATPEVVGPTASPSPASFPSPTTTPRRAHPDEGVRPHALGTLAGDWIFVAKQVPYPDNIWAELQIWAIPLDSGRPRIALAYDVSLGGIPEAIFDIAPHLHRQFSPDGTRVVVSVNGALVVVDLQTGARQPLGVSGYFPAWSKDGSKIAYVSYLPFAQVVPPEQAIFVVSAGGGPEREIARIGYGGQAVEWSPDGSKVIVALQDGIALVDVASGRVLQRLTDLASGVSFASWRSATPQIAMATGRCDQTSTKLVGLDDAGAPERTLLDMGEPCPTLRVGDPRWNPASRAELLYVATRANLGAMPHEYRAHILNTTSGRDTTLPFDAYEATWTWQGDSVVYVRRAATGFFGDSVRVWRRDGTGERVLFEDTADPRLFGIASLRY